jgi:hypothetical protein
MKRESTQPLEGGVFSAFANQINYFQNRLPVRVLVDRAISPGIRLGRNTCNGLQITTPQSLVAHPKSPGDKRLPARMLNE